MPRRGLVLAVLFTAEVLVMLGGIVVSVALPEIGDDVGLRGAQLQWVITAYRSRAGTCRRAPPDVHPCGRVRRARILVVAAAARTEAAGERAGIEAGFALAALILLLGRRLPFGFCALPTYT